ncbi:hypothetical protein ACNKHL_08905 [Shigella flexneri]
MSCRQKSVRRVGCGYQRSERAGSAGLNARKAELESTALNARLAAETIRCLPAMAFETAVCIRLPFTIDRLSKLSSGQLGFPVATEPESKTIIVDLDALNSPGHHPARADHDTFSFDTTRLLRTQTSGVHIRTMKAPAAPDFVSSHLATFIVTTTTKLTRQCPIRWKV